LIEESRENQNNKNIFKRAESEMALLFFKDLP
jgi:hypothetical protein